MKLLFLVTFVFFSQLCFSHSNHDHGPGKTGAPHSGIIKETQSFHFELVSTGKDLKLYIYDVNMKPLENLSDYKIVTHTALPRKDKEELALILKEDHFAGQFDKKGSHRFTLYVQIQIGDKLENAKWVID